MVEYSVRRWPMATAAASWYGIQALVDGDMATAAAPTAGPAGGRPCRCWAEAELGWRGGEGEGGGWVGVGAGWGGLHGGRAVGGG